MIDLNEIKQQVKSVIEYSQDLEDLNVDTLIDNWYAAKHKYIEKFGQELIKTVPEKVQFVMTPEEQMGRIDNFISFIADHTYNLSLGEFVNSMRDCFFENLTNKDYEAPKGKVIKKGTKLIKAFKYFESDPMFLAMAQNEASELIQENKIEGYLHISVHPLDFLSVSENNYNWRSCHSLDGDYSAGNLSYMCDSSTVVCYLDDGKNDKRLERFSPDVLWNSKKWRMLLFFSNDTNMVFAGRQYPFSSRAGLEMVKEKLLFNQYGDWYNDYIDKYNRNGKSADIQLKRQYVPIDGRLIDMKELIHDNSELHFNDLLRSTYYQYPYYAYKYSPWFDRETGLTIFEDTRFNIGSQVMCLKCGKYLIEESHSVVCNDCYYYDDDYYFCEYCGSRVEHDDVLFFEGDTYCPECFYENVTYCRHCDTEFWNNKKIYNMETNKIICPNCGEEIGE